MGDQIDNFAPGGGVVDITGTSLNLRVNFADSGATQPTDHPALVLSPKLVAPQTTPLSELFDKRWSDPPPSGGKSVRDLAGDAIRKRILKAVPDAFAFTIDLPNTGTLRSFVQSDVLFLSYKLSNCSVTASKPVFLGLDLTFTARFSIETLIIIDFKSWPDMTPRISTHIEDLKIDADSVLASVVSGIFDILGKDLNSLFPVGSAGSLDPGLAGMINTLLDDMAKPGVPAGIKSCTSALTPGQRVRVYYTGSGENRVVERVVVEK
jgi:hypothetical protein